MTEDLDRATHLLLHELREDEGDLDEAARTRIERRLRDRTSRHVLRLVPRPPRGGSGARVGLAAALLVGSALGAGGHALVSSIADRFARPSSPIERAAPANAATVAATGRRSPPAPLSPPIELAPPSPLATNPQPVLPKVATPRPPSSAAGSEELRELEDARVALANGQAPRALASLRRHTQLYPRSIFEQERSAMIVKALVATGNHGEARAAADGFRNNYPDSLLLDSVERAAGSIP